MVPSFLRTVKLLDHPYLQNSSQIYSNDSYSRLFLLALTPYAFFRSEKIRSSCRHMSIEYLWVRTYSASFIAMATNHIDQRVRYLDPALPVLGSSLKWQIDLIVENILYLQFSWVDRIIQ